MVKTTSIVLLHTFMSYYTIALEDINFLTQLPEETDLITFRFNEILILSYFCLQVPNYICSNK